MSRDHDLDPAAAGRPHRGRLDRGGARSQAAQAVLMAFGGALVAFVFVAPYLVMVLDSLRPSSDVKSTPPSILPKVWQWDTYAQVLGDERFLAWLKTSSSSRPAPRHRLVVAIPAAYFTARHRFPGRGAFLLLVLVTQMFAPTSLVVGLYREFFDSTWSTPTCALIFTNAAFNLAFAIWILHGFFASIPLEVEEAAELDGAAAGRPVPGHAPADAPWPRHGDDLHVHRGVERVRRRPDAHDRRRQEAADGGHRAYITGYEQHWDQLFAASVIAVVPVVILFAIIEKHLVGGLTAGSVE